MSNFEESFLILLLIIFIQLIIYTVFLQPLISTWGASENEIKMPLVGDNSAPYIRSTRAISINAPVSEVWKWLIQLGADRGGFFTYSFIEKALGYETRDADNNIPEFQEMKVGRIVPGSIDESKSIIKYNFPVVYVEPGSSFVLKGWGTFVLNRLNTKQARLIVRTHGRELPGLMSKIFFENPLHYIMERRMLMGIKARAEAGSGVQLSSTADILWFLGVSLSGIGIFLMALMGRGIQCALLSAIYGVIWLWPLLIFDPKPTYSMMLLFTVAATMAWFVF